MINTDLKLGVIAFQALSAATMSAKCNFVFSNEERRGGYPIKIVLRALNHKLSLYHSLIVPLYAVPGLHSKKA